MTPGTGARPPLTVHTLLFILRETVREWNDDKVPRLGAALAFYSMLSIGPLLLIAIAIASAVFGHDANGYILAEIRRLIGYQGAQAVGAILADAHSKTTSTVVTLIGTGILLVSATGFFAQMQDALNTIWNVDNTRSDIAWFFKKRVLSFAMILAIGFLLLVALVLSTALSVVSTYFPGAAPGFLFHAANLIVTFAVITVLFGMIFKILPDVHIKWRDVWVGAGLTALMFSMGKYLIGVYLARSAFSSAYGAAGSVIVVLAWIYYSAQIFFIGAEFTQVYTRYMGRQIVIKKGRPQPINVAKEDTAHRGAKPAADVLIAESAKQAE